MKKRVLLFLTLISLIFIIGCTTQTKKVEFKDNFIYDEMSGITYKFTGKSEHFGFETGKVYYSDTAKEILITNFILIKDIKNIEQIDLYKLNIEFDGKPMLFGDVKIGEDGFEKHLNENIFSVLRTVPETDENGEFIGDIDAFCYTTKDDFKTKIKVEITYCIKEKCIKEELKMTYFD